MLFSLEARRTLNDGTKIPLIGLGTVDLSRVFRWVEYTKMGQSMPPKIKKIHDKEAQTITKSTIYTLKMTQKTCILGPRIK